MLDGYERYSNSTWGRDGWRKHLTVGWVRLQTATSVQSLSLAVLGLLRGWCNDSTIPIEPFFPQWDFERGCMDLSSQQVLDQFVQPYTFERTFARSFAELAHALEPLPHAPPADFVDNPYKLYAPLLCQTMPEPVPSFIFHDEFWRSPLGKRRGVTYGVTAHDGPYEPWVFEKSAMLKGCIRHGLQVLRTAGYTCYIESRWTWFGTGSLLEHMRALWPIKQAAELKLQAEIAAAASSPTPSHAPATRERSVEELRKLQVRVALKVATTGSTPCVSVQLWVPRRCLICDGAISTSLMVSLQRRPQRQQTCDKAVCRLRHHDQQAVTQCEQLHRADHANFRDKTGQRVRSTWAEKALPWATSLSYFWDCKQCTKVPHPGHRPPRGCKWDAVAGDWAQTESATPVSTLPPPPAKDDFIDGNRHFDQDGYVAAKKSWFELPGAKRPSEEYSEAAYLRAFRRAKRNPEEDNRKRKERANYNVYESLDAKRDREYSEWA